MSRSTFNISNFRSQVLGKGLAKNNRFEVIFNMPKDLQLMPKYKMVYNPPKTSVFQQVGNILGTVGAIGNIIKSRAVGSTIATNVISALTGSTKDRAVSLKDDQTVCLLCETANLPGINLSVKSQRIYGPAYQRVITSEYGGEGISLTFLVDREMIVKRLFDGWMESIVAGSTAIGKDGDWRNTYTVAFPSDYQVPIRIRQLDEFDNVTYEIELEDAFPRTIMMMDLNHSNQNQPHRLTVTFAYRRWRPLPLS